MLTSELAQMSASDSIIRSELACFEQPLTLVNMTISVLSRKLATPSVSVLDLTDTFRELAGTASNLDTIFYRDLRAVVERDPACDSLTTALLFYKGYHALAVHRFAHILWSNQRRPLARWLQNRSSEVLAVDIHPAARLGCGIFIDHATGIVIGETSVVDDDVSLLHEVTLGGTGKQSGDRHPKVGKGVMIGAGAKILGNITLGEGSKVGAGSVVLRPVPSGCTVVGVPAQVVGKCCSPAPAQDMDQSVE
jgi:serine O-acetyltransferase